MSFLANAIRSARQKRAWTQTELAQKLAVSQGTVSFWENGVETPALARQVQLIELIPEILHALAEQELALIDRIQALERQVFDGKCACDNCSCTPETAYTPISRAVREQKTQSEKSA